VGYPLPAIFTNTMTPAINLAKQSKIAFTIHQYQHDDNNKDYGQEVADKLNIAANRIYKTLVVQLDNKILAVAIIPVTKQLNMKLFAKSLKAKKALMANSNDVLRSTGYILGGVSPLAQKKALATVIDSSAEQLESMFVSAGKRGLEIELTPNDLIQLCHAQFSAISR
jgi:Cys-tRNA(Pro)/Cys-tRNA(Cys) deacylase